MYKTLFDISTSEMQGTSFFGAASIFFWVPFSMGLLWFAYRYTFVPKDAVVFINHSPVPDMNPGLAVWYRAVLRNGMLVVLGFIALIVLAIISLCALGDYKTTHRYINILNNNESKTVEGPIEEFEPYPTSTKRIVNPYESSRDRYIHQRNESFSVNNILFVYSCDYLDGGFEGNPQVSTALAQARIVKIWYLDNPDSGIDKKIILKIAIKGA